MHTETRLSRSTDDRMIAGVAGGLAHYFDVDPTIVRLAWLVLFFTTGPLALLAYLACALVIPRESSFRA
jgi:phage shock protein C